MKGLFYKFNLMVGVFLLGFTHSIISSATDLGGDCCADLEERVADLDATTVRKGTRKTYIRFRENEASSAMDNNDRGSEIELCRRSIWIKALIPCQPED